ncbi:hypothetical protein [Polyangium jinanense]|uniref:Uncharacterized protein n=1 Tax=Polyangium jinanense TaxID=2829994 RepID=A0A9X3X7X5_9BACT|nr:hypothetical protein [Polyangium jinanense]MDC3960577.1 hypothetical protein [Polyangium jinanense]MDC3985439.1 hypothetical protein [Polyangium jinanense]
MNAIKSLLLAVMSMGLVGTASVARAEQPVEEGIVAETEGALMDNEATEERNITSSDEALSSQPPPFDNFDRGRRGWYGRCMRRCQRNYFRCERFEDRFGPRHHFRPGRCESEYRYCVRRVCGFYRFDDDRFDNDRFDNDRFDDDRFGR